MSLVDHYFELAEEMAKASTCVRAQVGAVLVDPQGITRSMWYNVENPQDKQCAFDCPRAWLTEADQPRGVGYENCISIHAEEACVGAFLGCVLTGWHIYVTREPCPERCQPLLTKLGITWHVRESS